MRRIDLSKLFCGACGVVFLAVLAGCDTFLPTPDGSLGAAGSARPIPVQLLSPSPVRAGVYSGEINCDSMFTSSLFGELSTATAAGPLTVNVGPDGVPLRESRGDLNLAGLQFTRIDQGIVVNTNSVIIASLVSFPFGTVTLQGASTLSLGTTEDGSLQITLSVLAVGVNGGEVLTLRDDCSGPLQLTSSVPTSSAP